jgi:hypothetical protein
MKKSLTRLFCCIVLLTGLITLLPESSKGQSAQPVTVKPTEIYRFVVSYNDGGFLLTGIFQEGVANNYSPPDLPLRANRSIFAYAGMYIPPSGYTPDPAVGLVPLHRWTVIQNGWRTHYYYSTYYTQQPPDRYYNGIAGYVFPPGTTTFRGMELTQMSVWYSQSYGFWNGTGVSPADAGYFIEQPPNGSFVFQGDICAMPGAEVGTRYPPPPNQQPPTIFDVTFYPPPPPPPPPPPGSCNVSQATRNACAHNGGWWNDETCSCEY